MFIHTKKNKQNDVDTPSSAKKDRSQPALHYTSSQGPSPGFQNGHKRPSVVHGAKRERSGVIVVLVAIVPVADSNQETSQNRPPYRDPRLKYDAILFTCRTGRDKAISQISIFNPSYGCSRLEIGATQNRKPLS